MTEKESKLNDRFYPCPCCGMGSLGSEGNYEICSICFWEDDPIQSRRPDFEGGANKLSLNQAKKEWQVKGAFVKSLDTPSQNS